MRCKIHPYECGVGVCAPCLRERLLALIAAQNEASAAASPSPPPPLAFPRSVSPYLSRRRSDASTSAACRHRHPLFFSTPQIGPSAAGDELAGSEKRWRGKFSILSSLFGHSRSGEPSIASRASSWLSPLIRRKKTTEIVSPELASPAAVGRARRSFQMRDRGVSPERGEEEAESPWRATPSPMRSTASRRRHGGGGGGISGFAVCLSPLARPRPCRRRGSGAPAEVGLSGDLRSARSPRHISSLEHNRSRKLTDFGRFR
ncbi:uncharacterized protein [Typha latifolia]|uniref:uncharacterized protein n=1 Tax=Typha latifolia TaxID=4733 RepID=UPI003C2C9DD1